MTIQTNVTADVDRGRPEELVAAYRQLLTDGLLHTQLLGDGRGHWSIHSLEVLVDSREPR